MVRLGLSPSAIHLFLQKPDWIDIYCNELIQRCIGLSENDFPQKYFTKIIKPRLERALEKELSGKAKRIDIRNTVQRWMLISHYKAQSLIRLMLLIPGELTLLKQTLDKYNGIPIGPVHSDVFHNMTNDEKDSWHQATIALAFSHSSVMNILGLFVSELFFTFEAMARTLCIGSCLEFALKSILPSVTIQHDEINQSLRRLGKRDKEKVACRLCPINDECFQSPSYYKISLIYELLYHLRTIKDYRLEFYFEHGMAPFILEYLVPKGFESLCVIDKVLNRIFQEYMISPLPLVNHKEEIYKLFKHETS